MSVTYISISEEHRRSQHGTYHFECVELFLDLLSQHRREAIARSNISTTIVFSTRPRVVEDDTRAEGCTTSVVSLRGARGALGVLTKPQGGHKVVLVADIDRVCSAVALSLVVRSARRAAGR